MKPARTIAGLLLAAGAARRMGTAKQLLLIDEKTLVRRQTEALLDSGCSPVCVVVGAHAEPVGQAISDLNVKTVFNARWSEGMGTSLVAGVQSLQTHPEVGAVCVALCDQPGLTAAVFKRLQSEFLAHSVSAAASQYGEHEDSRGVPAIFSAALFPLLLALPSQAGAKKLLRELGAQVKWVAVPEAATDLDTPQDFRHYLGLSSKAALNLSETE